MGTISNHIKLAREKDGMNQTEFAKKLGVSQAYISKIENGDARLTSEMIEKISVVLNTPLLLLPTKAAKEEFARSNSFIQENEVVQLKSIAADFGKMNRLLQKKIRLIEKVEKRNRMIPREFLSFGDKTDIESIQNNKSSQYGEYKTKYFPFDLEKSEGQYTCDKSLNNEPSVDVLTEIYRLRREAQRLSNEKNNHEKSAEIYEQILEDYFDYLSDELLISIAHNLNCRYIFLGEYDLAHNGLMSLIRLIESLPSEHDLKINGRADYRRAMIYNSLGMECEFREKFSDQCYSQSIQFYEKAHDLQPDDMVYRFNLWYCHAIIGLRDKKFSDLAEKRYKNLKLNPKFKAILNCIDNVLFNRLDSHKWFDFRKIFFA